MILGVKLNSSIQSMGITTDTVPLRYIEYLGACGNGLECSGLTPVYTTTFRGLSCVETQCLQPTYNSQLAGLNKGE